ncbi:MAG: CBS domain-containing protein [Candidatus Aenigmarchaeota archaeon]|nr:CBS domain-containing protein [Candidatus Aenigmarchaeota archaeon]
MSTIRAKDVMRKYVVTVEPSFTMDEVAKIMSSNRIGSVVVLDGQKPVGIVTSEDLVGIIARGESPKQARVKDLAGRRFISASPEEKILDLVKLMIKSKVKRIPIVKEGRLQGIVTDKEILLTAPEMIDVLSEKLKARVERVAPRRDTRLSGICEGCEGYADDLRNEGGEWLCEDCAGQPE